MTHREELASLPLSERIAMLIVAANTDQEGLAAILGTPRETVNRWLNHHARPGRDNRRKLAELASQLYEETISPDLFRAYVTDRQTPLEEAAGQLVQTSQDLSEATRALVELLGEQRLLVQRMQRIATVLEQRESASGGGGGSG